MKSVLMTIVALASITATAATYVTVQDCNFGESGQECRTVTYKVRKGGAAPQIVHPQGASSEGYVQTPANYGVPAWLQSDSSNTHEGTANPSFPGFEAP